MIGLLTNIFEFKFNIFKFSNLNNNIYLKTLFQIKIKSITKFQIQMKTRNHMRSKSELNSDLAPSSLKSNFIEKPKEVNPRIIISRTQI